MGKRPSKSMIRNYKIVFGTVEGKRLLDDLSNVCYELSPTFIDQNPAGSAYREGRRGVMLYIRDMLKQDTFEKREVK